MFDATGCEFDVESSAFEAGVFTVPVVIEPMNQYTCPNLIFFHRRRAHSGGGNCRCSA